MLCYSVYSYIVLWVWGAFRGALFYVVGLVYLVWVLYDA